MDELFEAIAKIMAAGPSRILLSGPRAGQQSYRRAVLRPLEGRWQLERLTDTQAFHENMDGDALPAALERLLREDFTQLTATAPGREYSLKLTKKGGVLQSSRPLPQAGPAAAAHGKKNRRLIPEGADIPALYDLGVFTPEGRVVAARRDKFRQIARFVELVDDALPSPPPKGLRVLDFGCGKSYLTFVLYHHFTQTRGISVRMTGLDLRRDVVDTCAVAAKKYGYAGLDFAVGDIAGYDAGGPVDMVVTLHACNTATDHALAKAVGWGAGAILCVPCCQHEAAGQMHSDALALMTRYGIVKQRAAALMTDAIRANLLAACGYKTQLVEFVEEENTPKNIMIRAVRAALPQAVRRQALAEAESLCEAFGLSPCLLRLMRQQGLLPAPLSK